MRGRGKGPASTDILVAGSRRSSSSRVGEEMAGGWVVAVNAIRGEARDGRRGRGDHSTSRHGVHACCLSVHAMCVRLTCWPPCQLNLHSGASAFCMSTAGYCNCWYSTYLRGNLIMHLFQKMK